MKKNFLIVLTVFLLIVVCSYVLYVTIFNKSEEVIEPDTTATDFDSVLANSSQESQVGAEGELLYLDQNTNVYRHIPRNGSAAYNQLTDMVAPERFILFKCQPPNMASSVGLMLTEVPGDPTQPYSNLLIIRTLDQWEPFILQDIGSLLFPNVSSVENNILIDFTSYELLPFVEGHMSSFEAQNQRYELHYAWNQSYIFFASSQICLELMAESVYSPYTH